MASFAASTDGSSSNSPGSSRLHHTASGLRHLDSNGCQPRLEVVKDRLDLAGYVSVRFLVRFFQTRTLLPFAAYCLVVGTLSILRFA
jgi:hypothetical protein